MCSSASAPASDTRSSAPTLLFDDGSGAALFAGGAFEFVDGTIANRLAKWDGTRWLPLGTGANGTVSALIVCPSWRESSMT